MRLVVRSYTNELSRQTILTEGDWEKFKTLFEKIYPGFFLKLKEMVPDITVAEQRMSPMLGILLKAFMRSGKAFASGYS